jgi:hypothetical protein
MKHAPDMTNPITDLHAAQMYELTPPEAVPGLSQRQRGPMDVWERTTPEVRDIFRARARRALQGDDSFAPWRFARASPMSVT